MGAAETNLLSWPLLQAWTSIGCAEMDMFHVKHWPRSHASLRSVADQVS